MADLSGIEVTRRCNTAKYYPGRDFRTRVLESARNETDHHRHLRHCECCCRPRCLRQIDKNSYLQGLVATRQRQEPRNSEGHLWREKLVCAGCVYECVDYGLPCLECVEYVELGVVPKSFLQACVGVVYTSTSTFILRCVD